MLKVQQGKNKVELSHQGFTIVELLIVVVVIAVLATVAVVAYNGIQQRARDARRISDIGHIDTAIKLFIVDKGHAPGAGDPYCTTPQGDHGCGAVNDFPGNTKWVALQTELRPYMGGRDLPKDPCGATCWEIGDQFRSYNYLPPGFGDNTTSTNTSYAIYNEGLETQPGPYGFGFSTFGSY